MPLTPPHNRAFRYAIVEDEPLARTLLEKTIESLSPEALLIWGAADGEEAFQRLTENPVDVLFLDVEFPPVGAFGLLERARDSGLRLPKIVFVTGHDEHAVKAFEWAACDFVLKPLSRDRVKETLERVRTSLTSLDLGALLSVARILTQDKSPERFIVPIRDRILILRWPEVMFLHTEFRQVYAHTSRGKVPLDRGMDELEVVLQERFLRIHRSSLINLDYLVEVRNPPALAGQAVMQDGTVLNVSRARMDDLLKRLTRMR